MTADSEDEQTYFDSDCIHQIEDSSNEDLDKDEEMDNDYDSDDDIAVTVQGIGEFLKNEEFIPDVIDFDDPVSPLKPNFDVSEESSPFEILQKILSDDVMNEVVRESNRYKSQIHQINPKSFQNWIDILLESLWQFMAVSLMMGLIKKPAIQDYWSNDLLFQTPVFGSVMPRHR